MKTTKFLLMAALALAFAACSNDDIDIQNSIQPAKAEGITITAQLAPKSGGAATRKVTEGTGANANTIVAEWAVDETIAILYKVNEENKKAVATVKSVDTTTGAATIGFTVDTNTANNTPCTLVYPSDAAKDDNSGIKGAADLIGAQNGELSAKLDIRVGTGTIQTSTPSLTVTTQPAAQFAIWKLTLKSGNSDLNAKKLLVNAGGVACNVTPASASNVLYVAVPAVAAGLVTMNATDGTDAYVYGKDGVTLEAGTYCRSEVTLTKVVPVDLGTAGKWANINIGAYSAEQYGSFFAWGGTTGYSSASPVTDGRDLGWNSGCPFWVSGPSYKTAKFDKYIPTGKESNWGGTGAPDNKLVLEAADDAARQNWGSKWRMPTKAEFQALLDNTTRAWTTENGVSGYKFTKNGNSIFLPAAGFRNPTDVLNQGTKALYWSSSLYSDTPTDAWYLDFNKDNANTLSNYRYFGQSVRAVYVGE